MGVHLIKTEIMIYTVSSNKSITYALMKLKTIPGYDEPRNRWTVQYFLTVMRLAS